MPRVQHLLEGLGSSPAAALSELGLQDAARLLHGFVYRFNLASDLAVMLRHG